MKVKRLNEKAVIPTRGSNEAAGYDLYACLEEPVEIAPGETKSIGIGLAMEVSAGNFGGIFARSGLSRDEGLRPANCLGVVDSDYRGEVIVALHNDSKETRVVTNGQKIAQLIILPYLPIDFIEVDELSSTERNANGFGSTGR